MAKNHPANHLTTCGTVQYNDVMPTKKQAFTFRLSAEAIKMIREYAEANGLSQTAVVEMAVRRLVKGGK